MLIISPSSNWRRGAPVAPPAELPSITLTSVPGGASLPFTFGHSFKKGDVASGSVVRVGALTTQCDVLNAWDDGSVKFAVLSVIASQGAGTPVAHSLSVVSDPGGADLTESDLMTAMSGKSIVVQCGALATISLSDLIGTAALLRTRILGPTMSEFHYTAVVDTHTRMFFEARVYSNGGVWVRYCVHNGYIKVAGSTNKVYVLTVTANGVQEYNASVDQKHHTRITNSYWLSADPEITPKHDTVYMQEAKVVPTYGWDNPAESAFSGLSSTYVPMGLADLPSAMGGAGYSPHIGVLPFWDALYITSEADPRAYQAVIVNAESAGTYSIHYLDENTNRPYAFSARPNLWVSAPDAIASSTGGTAASADMAHQPSVGYLAYLLTGDWHHMEELQFWATWNGFNQNYVNRKNAQCLIIQEAARGVAWGLRNLATSAAITPDGDSLQTEFSNSWRSNMVYRWNQYIGGSESTGREKPNILGAVFLYSGSGAGDAYTPGDFKWVDAPWMQHFLESVLGFTYFLEVPQQTSGNRTTHQQVALFAFQHSVGMLGDATGRPYPYAGEYGVDYGTTATANELLSPLDYYTTWLLQWGATKARDGYTDPPSTLGSPLLGTSGSLPSDMATGYWGNLHPAIAYAVQMGAPGAQDAYTRLTSASNYASGANTFNNTPQFGIRPAI